MRRHRQRADHTVEVRPIIGERGLRNADIAADHGRVERQDFNCFAGVEFGPRLFADPTTGYFRVFEVMRDYGMYERTEAPQYYPPVERKSAS